MQSMNTQLTEQDQQLFNKRLQDPNDEIGVRSDVEEDDEESDDDEYVHFDSLLNSIDKNLSILVTRKQMTTKTEWVVHLLEEIRWVDFSFSPPFFRHFWIGSLGNGGMTDDLSDEDDPMQTGGGGEGLNMEDDDDELDPDMNAARGGAGVGADPRQRGRGADDGKPRRQKKAAQPRAPYDDDENF
jgi:hypothetical protein